jgi:hypothetical protein
LDRFNKTQILGHGKVGKSYGLLSSFYFGKFSLVSMWLTFIALLMIGYIFTFHVQSDFEKESFKLKYEKSELLQERQDEQQRLSDMQSLEGGEFGEGMIEPEQIEYLW